MGAFGREEFARLAEVLAALRGSFVLSINDTPEVRRIFSAFDQAEVELTYTVGNGAPKAVGELIITPPGMKRREKARGLFDEG
ncbi:hypothetical protein EYW49_22650 [Siculibacillus lacustris]|uniref:DNA adenine methylase n=1 Tax=Siculibacillus lacustris TaxID=1549641 RepID=A0A4Q9VBY8_9HYPH|nr:hypothetical protein [Siculibacillus lacustris]TBW31959.1 hypothetical protein EYW49_22650 [Siculibacillus lacustris]